MRYDIFFSISQTPVDGFQPDEATMFANFFDQVRLADTLGFGVAWVAESHLSTEVQKGHDAPVIPHWQGEVGLNTDIVLLAQAIFAQTSRIEVGSAIMNILVNGGPIAAAERIAAFATLHGLNPTENRRLHAGFAAGRFDFMNRAHGMVPRGAVERALGPALKGLIFNEAAEIFCRLIIGEALSSSDIAPQMVTRETVRTDGHWAEVQAAAGPDYAGGPIALSTRWTFDRLKIVPADWRRALVQLVIGSHDPELQAAVNRWLPVQVFNLSITAPEKIEATHTRMANAYHPDGGPWTRDAMPRTVFVFLNEVEGLTPAERCEAAKKEATQALGAYWRALLGTVDPAKVARAADNALIGDAETVARQIVDRFHPDDRLMLWFDFFNHDNARVKANMNAFMGRVAPRVAALMGHENRTQGTGGENA